MITRSSRVSRRPPYLDDYICAQTYTIEQITSPYSITYYLAYTNLSTSHKSFIESLESLQEPSNYSQATNDPQWQRDMQLEIEALERNKT